MHHVCTWKTIVGGRGLRLTGLALAASGLLAGCATRLETRPDWQVTEPAAALGGLPYSLPMLQFDITLTRAITSCPQDFELEEGPRDKAPLRITQGALAFGLKAEAQDRYAPGERYLIDYEPLKAPFSTSALTISAYPNGTLKALNASADDQTADVIKEGLKFGFTVASLTAGVPPFDPGTGTISLSSAARPAGQPIKDRAKAIRALKALAEDRTFITCTPDAAKWTAEADANNGDQEDLTDQLTTANADVARTTAVAAARRSNLTHVTALDFALSEQARIKQELAVLVADKEGIDGKLSTIEQRVWPRAFDERDLSLPNPAGSKFEKMITRRSVKVLTPAKVAAWLKTLDPALADAFLQTDPLKDYLKVYLKADGSAVEESPGIPACRDASTKDPCLAAQLDAQVQLRLADTEEPTCSTPVPDSRPCRSTPVSVYEGGASRPSAGFQPAHRAPPARSAPPSPLPAGRFARNDRADPGIFIRSPAQGIIEFCRGLNVTQCAKPVQIYESKPVSAPQLGQLRYLPVRNEAFEASELSVLLRVDGSLETFSYKKTKAAAVGLAAAASDAVSQYKAFRDAEDAKKTSSLTSAREEKLATLDYDINLLTKQLALVKLQTPETPDAQKEIRDQTTRLEAEIALLNAERGKIEATAALTALTVAQP